MRGPAVSALLIASWLGVAAPASAQLGRVAHGAVEMPVRGAVALWDPDRPSLRIHLLPFEPTPEEVRGLQAEKSFFFFELERESPDPELWPGWMPHAHYQMSWSFDPDRVGDHEAAWLFVYAFGIGEQGSNLNLNTTAGEHPGTLSGEVKPGSRIRLQASGRDEIGGAVLSWELDLETEVLELLGEE